MKAEMRMICRAAVTGSSGIPGAWNLKILLVTRWTVMPIPDPPNAGGIGTGFPFWESSAGSACGFPVMSGMILKVGDMRGPARLLIRPFRRPVILI